MTDISNHDDIIDSRDVIARIEELEAEREALAEEVAETEAEHAEAAELVESIGADETAEAYAAHGALTVAKHDHGRALQALSEWDDDNAAELATLRALAEEASSYAADWDFGEQLIRDSYFRDYAMELAEELDLIPRDAKWPNTCIDWDQAARELQMDYTAVDFDGVTYWIR